MADLVFLVDHGGSVRRNLIGLTRHPRQKQEVQHGKALTANSNPAAGLPGHVFTPLISAAPAADTTGTSV